MDGGFGLGNGAVVDLDLDGFAENEDALDGAAARGDHEALCDGVGVGGAHGDWNLRCGVSAVGNIDGDEPVAGLGCGGKDAIDFEVGQAFVGVDPIGEEPGQVAVVARCRPQRRRPVALGPGGLRSFSNCDGFMYGLKPVPFRAAERAASPSRSRSIQKT